MFQVPILDVAIGMIFLFLLLSLLATAFQEVLAGRGNMRGKLLEIAISKLTGTLRERVLSHPLVRQAGERLPSYVAKENFSRVIIQEVFGPEGIPADAKTIQEKIAAVKDDQLRAVLQSLYAGAASELEQRIASWYETAMDRLSGVYKRHMQASLFWIGLTIAVAANADAIAVFRHLSSNDKAREAVIAQAVAFANEHPNDEALKVRTEKLIEDELHQQNEKLKRSLGVGWYWSAVKQEWRAAEGWFAVAWVLTKIIGWIISAYAITIGAPFWFDMLKKVIQIRNTGVKPGEKK